MTVVMHLQHVHYQCSYVVAPDFEPQRSNRLKVIYLVKQLNGIDVLDEIIPGPFAFT